MTRPSSGEDLLVLCANESAAALGEGDNRSKTHIFAETFPYRIE